MAVAHVIERSQSTLAAPRLSLARSALLALATVLVLTTILTLGTPASHVAATGVFGTLRGPGQPGLVAAHRGDVAVGPENTMPALEAALAGSSHFVETDVQLTRDGVPVLFHDHWLEGKTDGHGRVSEHTFAALSRLDAGVRYGPEFAGTRIPALAEFLEALALTDKRAILELKGHWTREEASLVTDLVGGHALRERVVIAAFDPSTLLAVQHRDPQLAMIALARTLPADPAGYTQRHGAIAIATTRQALLDNPWAVERMHRAGLGILLYTLNSRTAWREALALGVDGVITDRPESLGQWFMARSVR